MTLKIADIHIGSRGSMVMLAQDSDLIAMTMAEARQIGTVLVRLADEEAKVIEGKAHVHTSN